MAFAAAEAAAGCYPVAYYGTYSLGTKAGAGKVSLASRVRELRALGANMIVASGSGSEILDLLPPGMLAVPGCGLMAREDWKREGAWDEATARARLTKLAARFAHHPRVHGVCLTHEVTEYADHARRRWMYRLAKEYFPEKKVIHYYGHLWDRGSDGKGPKVQGYGLGGEVETDVLFVSLQAVSKARFHPEKPRRLEEILGYAARTPGVPVWGQTSVNADHKYVNGPGTMVTAWGRQGENLSAWADALFRTEHVDGAGRRLRLSGFFWRSLGRFPYDLGHPEFAAHREKVRLVGARRCGDHQKGRSDG
jgi:hypothetical protein